MQVPTNLYDWIYLNNIDNETFRFYVDGTAYEIGAGEARAFPRFMARIAVKHLITKILNKLDPDGKLTKSVKKRDELAAKIVIEERPMAMPIKKSQDEINQELVDKMNSASDLENVLSRRKSALKDRNPSQRVDDQGNPEESPTAPLIPPPGIKMPPITAPVKSGDITEDEPPKTAKTEAKKGNKVKPLETNEDGASKMPGEIKDNDADDGKAFKVPDRQTLLNYAKNDLKLDMGDKKTLASFEKMSDEDLAIELQYPLDEE